VDILSRREDYIRGEPKVRYAVLDTSEPEAWKYNIKLNRIEVREEVQDTTDVEIKEAYKIDETAQRLLKDPIVRKEDGFILYDGVIYIPAKMRTRIIKGYYSSIAEGYPRIGSTMERIQRKFYFLGMRKAVEKVIANCQACAMNKVQRHKLYR
jgi:Integrase zinc binding domain